MIPLEIIITGASLLLIISIVASKASSRFGIPSLLLFLFIGMLFGSEGLGLIKFDSPVLAQYIGVVALVFILFFGGLETEWKSVRPILKHGILLSTLGVFVTAFSLGAFMVFVFGFSWLEGLLFGSIVSSTDAAAVFSVLRSKKLSLSGEVGPLLELESGSNDPMAVFMTIGFIGLITGKRSGYLEISAMFFLQMGVGVLLGYYFGKAIVYLINKIKLEYDGLYPVLTLSLILLAYALTSFSKGNGFMAVYIIGLVMGNSDLIQKRNLIHFHGGVAWLMQITMFLALGLLVSIKGIASVAGIGILVSLFLMFVARPIGVFSSLAFKGFYVAQQAFISWVGLRGSVPIILATFPLIAGVKNSEMMFNIVFFVVLTSALFQGTSIPFAAKFFRVDAPLKSRKRYPIEFEHTDDLNTRLVEFTVPYDSWMIGKAVSEIGLPQDSLITLIARNEDFIVPSGQTVLESGDVLLTLVNNNNLTEITDLFSKKD
ncbi:MAG: potassium/proton antiporter [Endomicrobiales bacterium]|nr:potassium/proton antiporter [Endomicrobiales bacterium]